MSPVLEKELTPFLENAMPLFNTTLSGSSLLHKIRMRGTVSLSLVRSLPITYLGGCACTGYGRSTEYGGTGSTREY